MMRMTKYPASFFPQYRAYLEDTQVKKQHHRIFDVFRLLSKRSVEFDWRVVDLGCGTCEFGRWVKYVRLGTYIGVDLDMSNADCPTADALIEGDYTKMSFPHANVFVSLFSTEVHCSFTERYALYEQLFQSGMQAGLVAGFVYNDHCNDALVTENFGEQHYQSIEPLRWVKSSFEEIRFECKVPPGMFEQEFIEVWKILLRK